MADMVTLDTYRELENRKNKQIEELERKLEKETDHRIHNFNKAIEWKEKHRSLKKEIAELKARLNAISFPELKKLSKLKNQQIVKATKLLKFWVNDFYDSFNRSIKYEERHKAIVETEQFIKEIEK